MLQELGVREIARKIAQAAEGAMRSYREGLITDEPQITDRMLGAIQERLDMQEISPSPPNGDGPDGYPPPMMAGRTMTWRAKTLRPGPGAAAEERRHGADLLGVLEVKTPHYKTRKGFLAQAKRAEPDAPFSLAEWNRLVEQCLIMLDRTPDSFVFAYSKVRGVRVLPAVSVVGFDGRSLFDLYDRSVQSFFELHLECFIGDRRLHSPTIEVLDAMAGFTVDRILHFQGEATT